MILEIVDVVGRKVCIFADAIESFVESSGSAPGVFVTCRSGDVHFATHETLATLCQTVASARGIISAQRYRMDPALRERLEAAHAKQQADDLTAKEATLVEPPVINEAAFRGEDPNQPDSPAEVPNGQIVVPGSNAPAETELTSAPGSAPAGQSKHSSKKK